MKRFLKETTSLCPICLHVVPARLVGDDEGVFMEKECCYHGEFRVNVWKDSWLSWKTWDSLNYWNGKGNRAACSENKPCPLKCGLCSEHLTHACFIIVEVTNRCNLSCPVCFADAGRREAVEPSLEELSAIFKRALKSEQGVPSLQISGGEPTMREDLQSIIKLAKEAGFKHVVLDTNGVKIGKDREYLRKLNDVGLDTLYLQFDGVADEPFVRLRGQPLMHDKLRTIANCKLEGVGVILVPTVIRHVNFDQVGDIIMFAMRQMPTVRGVMFQPASYFGRYPKEFREWGRITMPEFLKAVEEQTSGMIKGDNFVPTTLGRWCESHCGFFCFAFKSGKLLHPITHFPTESQIEQILSERNQVNDIQLLDLIKEYWQSAEPKGELNCCEAEAAVSPDGLAISGMLFQDSWNIDVDRLKKCCIHVATVDGRIVSFCVYNITAEGGTSLYRGKDGCLDEHYS